MNHKRSWLEAVGDFLSGKGFYLVVLVCVAAIALSGYYLVQGVRGTLREDEPVSGSALIAENPSAPVRTPAPSAAPKSTPQPSARPSAQTSAPPAASAPVQSAAPAASQKPSPAPAPTPAALVFTWPVKGQVIAGFSVEALAYDETMGDWRTHGGMDIAAEGGTRVLAAAGGTVKSVYADALMGTTVEIDHGGGLVSLYANLAEVPAVAVGDRVTTGAVIGSVGSTAAAESGRDSHLHFAMTKDGAAVDPSGFLPEQ